MNNVSLYALAQQLTHGLWLLLWTQIPRVHSSVVRAADCRSAGPWFNSGWRSWFTLVTVCDNLTNQTAQRNNIMSPIITITRKSVKKKGKGKSKSESKSRNNSKRQKGK